MHSNTHIGVPSVEAGKSWSWLMCRKNCNIPVLENIQKLMEGKSKSGVGVGTGKALLRQETVPQETDWAQVYRDKGGSFETGRLAIQADAGRAELGQVNRKLVAEDRRN